VEYVGGNGSATAGYVGCPQLDVPANTTIQRSLTQLCPLNSGSNFGRLNLTDISATHQRFSAYSRVETFSGNGFSIEGYPVGNFSNASSDALVLGLRRQAAAPGYQSNCFVASLSEPVAVTLELRDESGVPIGTAQNLVLGENEVVRLLDVFNAVGAPAGDYSNVSAAFWQNGPEEPGFVAYCTVQNNESFDADFRIAKTVDPGDRGRGFVASGRDGVSLSTVLTTTGSQDDVFQVFWQHPDWARCYLSANVVTDFELRVKSPAGAVVAGGNNIQDTGKFFLGQRSTVNQGENGIWRIEVGASEGGSVGGSYALTCVTGNGGSDPLRVGRQSGSF
jgi:hypothetical protein